MHIDALVGGANSNSKPPSGTYLRNVIRGKNIIEERIPLKMVAIGEPKSCLPRNASLLPSSSTVIHGGLMSQGLVLPVKRGFPFAEESIVNNSGWASDFNPTNFPCDMVAEKVSMRGANDNTHKDLRNSHINLGKDYCDVPMGRKLNLYGEGGSQSQLSSAANWNNDVDQGRELIPYNGGSQNKLFSTANWIYCQNHTLTAPESIQEGNNSFQRPKVTVPIPRITPRKGAASRRAIFDRCRRVKKTENLKAMQELLPHSQKGTILAVMEEIIDYIKYLQLQIKVLTQSRLGGEPTIDPFIHLEGFGYYLLHDHMLNEPLEMTIGRMMEGNMSAVTQLLETKGLYLMPMPLEGTSKPGKD
ncbi:Transcription factor bhlh [Thalictrum thalictroides]|uniref:Transcription factor bhlh n=1 Tax=Thalictrum thalictroides TaxID=46969 RepID=A0A7J6W5F9_THATH|nr:Transcription factor bhlh [Thalictrum thalictroides]